MNSPQKNRKQILYNVFDQQDYSFSKKTEHSDHDAKLNNITANLTKLNIPDQQDLPDHSHVQVDLDYLFGCYKAFLQKISSDEDFGQGENEQKIQVLLEIINQSSQNVELSIGASIFLFEIIQKFRLESEQTAVILEVIFELIPMFIEQKNFYMIICMLEIITVVGPHETSLAHINRIISLIMDDNIKVVQECAVLALQ